MSEAWRPAASLEVLQLRARMRARVRTFLEATDTLEVETPMLSSAAPTEVHVHALDTPIRALSATVMYLQTSPEFPMKRLLAAGVGDCWQLARAFRDGERGRYHHPEFELLEWYRVDADHHELMDDVEALVAAAIGPEVGAPPAQRWSYTGLFRAYCGLDPLTASTESIQERLAQAGLEPMAGVSRADRSDMLDRLLSTAIVPYLPADRLTFVYDWPAEQAALARLDPADERVARRFEVYWGGIELANGFHELTDATEQQARFEADRTQRRRRGDADVPVDDNLLAALRNGLPDCAGVALGFDRLAMVAAGACHIDEVLAFPVERA